MTGDASPRWRLRFENFESALSEVEQAIERLRNQGLSDLDQAGLIQRFEYTWELGWKSMRDFLLDTGTRIKVPVAANVIRAANEVGLIDDGDSWFDAKDARNRMSHEHSRADAAAIVREMASGILARCSDCGRVWRMSDTAAIDLTPMQHAVLRDVFARYADRFDRVAIYGSRATGRARPGSDVDIVVYGSDDRLVGRLLSEFEDSSLSIFADVTAFEHIGNAKLRSEIVRDARTLFTADDLRNAGNAEAILDFLVQTDAGRSGLVSTTE